MQQEQGLSSLRFTRNFLEKGVESAQSAEPSERRPLYTHQSPRLIQLQDNLSDGLGEIIQT